MKNDITVVGLDVHKDTIVAAILPAGSETAAYTATIEHTERALAKLAERAARHGAAQYVYEASSSGYEIQRWFERRGHGCAVIAPGLTPVRPGDRVKTDRRDAEKLARLYRAGELTEVRVPDDEEEGARDLMRAREDILANRLRARHRLSNYLLRNGRIWRETKAWGARHTEWVRAQRFDEPMRQGTYDAYRRTLEETDAHLLSLTARVEALAEEERYKGVVGALRSLKGVDTLTALTIAVEVADFRRFPDASSFMGYTGLTGKEDSSGPNVRRGGISKAGNAHLRRVLVEAAWSYRHRYNGVGAVLARRRQGCPERVLGIARKAQDRLSGKFWRMVSKNKRPQVAAVAVARELSGFVWAVATCLADQSAA